MTYLVDHPTDFRGAFARLRREFRTLYFSAFQSHLWNLILARWIERSTAADQRVAIELKAGLFPFPRRLEPEQVQGAVRIGHSVAVVAEPVARRSAGRSDSRGARGVSA